LIDLQNILLRWVKVRALENIFTVVPVRRGYLSTLNERLLSPSFHPLSPPTQPHTQSTQEVDARDIRTVIALMEEKAAARPRKMPWDTTLRE
jgi:hypothetical protein